VRGIAVRITPKSGPGGNYTCVPTPVTRIKDRGTLIVHEKSCLGEIVISGSNFYSGKVKYCPTCEVFYSDRMKPVDQRWRLKPLSISGPRRVVEGFGIGHQVVVDYHSRPLR